MAKTYPVKWYSNEMQGAPTIAPSSGYVPSWVSYWKAILVDGFGSTLLTSLVWDATTGWAKATIDAGHTFLKDQIIEITGANEAEYLGEHRVMQVSSTEAWFELEAPAAGPATGTISMKTPGLGWLLAAEAPDGNSAIFEAAGDEGNVCWRVEQSESYFGSYQKIGMVEMVENVRAFDDYDLIERRAWPASHWCAWVQWDLVGDSKLFWWMPCYATAYNNYNAGARQGAYIAGYINSIRPGDRYHFVMNHLYTTVVSSTSYSWGYYDDFNRTSLFAFENADQKLIARAYHQLPGTVSFKMIGGAHTFMGAGLDYPNKADNGYYIDASPIPLVENGSTLRGFFPGIVNPFARNSGLYRKNLKNLPSFPGEILRMLLGSHTMSGTGSSEFFTSSNVTLAAFKIGDAGWRA